MQLCVVAFILSYCFLPVTTLPQLSGSCPFINDQFVKEGTIVLCICEDNDPGVIDVFWDSPNPDIIEGLKHPNAAILEKNFTRDYNLDTIACISINIETGDNTISKVIKIAYGPDRVFMEVEPSSKYIDICPTCSNILAVKCQAFNFVPSEVTRIYMNGTLVANSNLINITRFDTGGPLNITCVSWNGLFQDLFATVTSIFTVREAPTSPPLMTINGSQNSPATVVEGMHQIVCRVNGGYPIVDNVTVQCGSKEPVTQPGEVISMFDFTRDLNRSNCSCWASHVTGYYNQRTSIVLIVQYAPEIINFTINGMTGAQNVPKGNSVAFACQAVGNPEPVLKLFSSRRNTMLLTESSPLSFVKDLQCNDSDIYTCQADNSIGQTNRSIPITVLCAPPTASPNSAIIIAATVVPIVVLAAIIAVIIAVIIHRKRARSKAQASTIQLRPSPLNDYRVTGTHLSGNYNDLQRASHGSPHPYATVNPGNSSVLGEHTKHGKDYESIRVPASTFTPSSVQSWSDTAVDVIPATPNIHRRGTNENKPPQIKDIQPADIRESSNKKDYESMHVPTSLYTLSPVQLSLGTGVEIIPNTPNAHRHEQPSKIEDIQPPDIPEKTSHKTGAPWKSEAKLDDILSSRGKTRSPRVEVMKPPPIPTKSSAVYANMRPKPDENKKD